eukprot:Sspe_Gene.61782::Locus_34394_Transcript_1_1_Confidence_1.000_Length_1544::g.61782::m.61782
MRNGYYVLCGLGLCLAWILNLLTTKSLSISKAGVIIVTMMLYAAVVIDILTFGEFEYYTSCVVAMDCLLLCNCSPGLTVAMRNLVVVVVCVQSVEQCVGIGLYDVLRVLSIDPPKPRGAEMLPTLLLQRLQVFVIDFAVTRHFATQMREERAKVLKAITVTQNIAVAMSRFDLAEATTMIASQADTLPAELNEAFTTLTTYLHFYKPYLPLHLLGEPQQEAGEGSSTTPSTKSSSESDVLRMSTSSRDMVVVNAKNVVLMVVNLIDFLPGILSDGVNKGNRFLERYLSFVVTTVRSARGLTDHFLGDRVLISFNAARACLSSSRCAVDCALALRSAPTEITGRGEDRLSLVIALAGGSVRCGPMGCSGMTRYTVLGRVAGWVHVLERYLTLNKYTVGVDSSVANSIEHAFHFRLLDQVRYDKAERMTRIWTPTDERQYIEQEW